MLTAGEFLAGSSNTLHISFLSWNMLILRELNETMLAECLESFLAHSEHPVTVNQFIFPELFQDSQDFLMGELVSFPMPWCTIVHWIFLPLQPTEPLVLSFCHVKSKESVSWDLSLGRSHQGDFLSFVSISVISRAVRSRVSRTPIHCSEVG